MHRVSYAGDPSLPSASSSSAGASPSSSALTMSLSSSAAVRQRKRPVLPLITCNECEQHTVLELEVKSDENGNRGRIFYKCPARKCDGTGCPFWYWEEEYVEVLAKIAEQQKLIEKGMNCRTKDQCAHVKGEEQMKLCKDESVVDDIRALVGIGRQITVLLNWLLFVCCCVLLLDVASVMLK
ncbi:unnamed protein product [Urochloa humidicola]